MSEYEVVKDVPFVWGAYKYPFSMMEIGDSFFVDGASAKSATSQSKVYGKKHGKQFTSRTEGRGVRIWRVDIDYQPTYVEKVGLFTLEKGVPIPEKGSWKYPFSEMAIGDRVELTGDVKSIRNAAHAYAYNHKKEFRTKTVDRNTISIWRAK